MFSDICNGMDYSELYCLNVAKYIDCGFASASRYLLFAFEILGRDEIIPTMEFKKHSSVLLEGFSQFVGLQIWKLMEAP